MPFVCTRMVRPPDLPPPCMPPPMWWAIMVFGAGCYTPGNDPYAASFFGAENAPLLPPPGTTDASSLAKGVGKHAGREIKEWQAIMDHMRRLPVKKKGDLPVIPVDERASEVRAIKAG